MSTAPALVAVAHGTRDPAGPVCLEQLVDQVRARLVGVPARIGYVDVIGPTLDEVLAELDGPAVVVPMFLSSGYHVRVDVPEAVARRAGSVAVTEPLGPDRRVVAAVAQRLEAAVGGGRHPDAVVLAAAGSSVAAARADVERAAGELARFVGRRVEPAYVTAADPPVPEAVSRLRDSGHAVVGVASYLLAPGLFQRRLAQAGADVVGAPIGAHPAVVELLTQRYRSGVSALAG